MCLSVGWWPSYVKHRFVSIDRSRTRASNPPLSSANRYRARCGFEASVSLDTPRRRTPARVTRGTPLAPSHGRQQRVSAVVRRVRSEANDREKFRIATRVAHVRMGLVFMLGLTIATAASAGAASLITGRQIKDGTITKKDLPKALEQQWARTGVPERRVIRRAGPNGVRARRGRWRARCAGPCRADGGPSHPEPEAGWPISTDADARGGHRPPTSCSAIPEPQWAARHSRNDAHRWSCTWCRGDVRPMAGRPLARTAL